MEVESAKRKFLDSFDTEKNPPVLKEILSEIFSSKVASIFFIDGTYRVEFFVAENREMEFVGEKDIIAMVTCGEEDADHAAFRAVLEDIDAMVDDYRIKDIKDDGFDWHSFQASKQE